MSKTPKKLTEQQILKIKSLYAEGKNAYQIHKLMGIGTNIVRYHIERVLLAKLNPIPEISHQVPMPIKSSEDYYLQIIEDLKRKNKLIIETFMDNH